MKLLKKILSLLLIASLAFSIVSCDNDTPEVPDDTNNGGIDNGGDADPVYADYTVTVLNSFGQPVSDVSVLVHKDGGADYNVCAAPVQTDKNGKAVFRLEIGSLYSVSLLGVSEMYITKSGNTRADRYVIDGAETLVLLEINEQHVPSGYRLGDTIANFTLTDIYGNEYELYDLLKEKRAVALNFWYCGCVPCQREFPALNTAYNNYKDHIEVLAINDTSDSLSKIMSFADDHNLTLDMPVFKANGNPRISLSKFATDSYPTTVIVDRYGRICFIHSSSVTDVTKWNKLFAFFTAEDYTSTVIENFESI
jgi:peroxiredoxin